MLYRLPIDLFKEIALKYETIEKICKYFELYYSIKEKRVNSDRDFLTQLSKLKSFILFDVLKNSKMQKVVKNMLITVNKGILIYEGSVQFINEYNEDEIVEGLIGFKPGEKSLKTVSDCTIFVLDL